MVQPKERGGRRRSDWYAICMEEREFVSINKTNGEECCAKKTANIQLCSAIYTLWAKDKVNIKAGRVRLE